MKECFFVSDLHGRAQRYEKLFAAIVAHRPAAVFVGGDLTPHAAMLGRLDGTGGDFIAGFLRPHLQVLRRNLGDDYPVIFVIMGNDDPAVLETSCIRLEDDGLCRYAHFRCLDLEGLRVYGYAYVPPTPFLLKDWERYDVSRYLPPGGVSPEDGYRSVVVPTHVTRYATIARDLDELVPPGSLDDTIMLFHSPPAETKLDRAGLDGRSVDNVPLELHVGSIAIRRFIESRQPRLTLHGHIHESAEITGEWRDRIGNSTLLSAAHDGPELALVRFDVDDLGAATRELL